MDLGRQHTGGRERAKSSLLQSDYLVHRNGNMYLILSKFLRAWLRTATIRRQREGPEILVPGLPTQMTPLASSNESLAAGSKFRFLKGCSLFGFGRWNLKVHIRLVAENLGQKVLAAVSVELQFSTVWGLIGVPVHKTDHRDRFIVVLDHDHVF